jgi:hypothetical protein
MSTGFTKGTGRIGHTLKKFTECLTANLSFISGSSVSPGMLSVGLISGIGSITGYVIEWHLNSPTGNIVFKSGLNPNESVNAIHPFVNEPIVSGDLYAVVKYIIINGIKYSSYINIGQYSPDLKVCFNYINVTGINCSTANTSGLYTYRIIYSNLINPAQDAYRTIKFDINSTTKALGVSLQGNLVVDKVSIRYVKISDINNPIQISGWAVGTNNIGNDFVNTPYKLDGVSLSFIAPFTGITYETGDYVLIEIVPRVYELNNNNTDWTLYLKCLTDITPYVGPSGSRTIDPNTIIFVWEEANCRYKLTYRNLADYILPTAYNYITRSSYSAGVGEVNGLFTSYFPKSTNAALGNINGYINTCYALSGQAITSKAGNVLTFVFTNSTDYNYYKTSYNSLIANSNWSNYTSDDSNKNHFKICYIQFINGTICGDAGTAYTYWFSAADTFNFNDSTTTITVTKVLLTTSIVTLPCSSEATIAANACSLSNGTYNYADFSRTHTLHLKNAFTAYVMNVSNSDIYNATFYLSKICMHSVILNPLQSSDWLIYPNIEGSAGYVGYRATRFRFEVINFSDPVNNFKIYNALNDNGTVKSTDVLVYQKINGVVTVF